ncbi:hypothetical protein WN943_021192 [Citrus x changshan-huyou]
MNKIPSKLVISLLKIYFDSHLPNFTFFIFHCVDDFLRHDNIFCDMPSGDETSLSWTNQVR